jgi:hypothetical protein
LIQLTLEGAPLAIPTTAMIKVTVESKPHVPAARIKAARRNPLRILTMIRPRAAARHTVQAGCGAGVYAV